jgi:uncharacterized protein involved in exopolysaccharide biosynthesis
MQSNFKSPANDEIQLKDIFIRIWVHKLLVACSCVFGIFLSIYVVSNAKKEFSSTAVFSLSSEKTSLLSAGNTLGKLATISGLGNTKDNPLIRDEIMGREFIELLDKSVDFQSDTFFNNYNPNRKESAWKSVIKNLIGWQNTHNEGDESIWQGITNTYRNVVEINLSLDNSIILTVTHEDPNRSAEITNSIMEKIIALKKEREINKQKQQLSYLSQTLAAANGDLVRLQSSLKNFTVKNSSIPDQKFTVKSLELDALRAQLNRTSQIHDALAKLSSLIGSGSIKEDDYQSLREAFPIVDQVSFRRVLGQSEIISFWTWPEKSTVNTVYDSLTERRKRLEALVNVAETEALRAAETLEKFATLQRQVTISEATYTVLIEQVKAQSMVAGFRPDSSRIFEYASPPLTASSPNQKLILASGGILGLLTGCIIALMMASLRGVYYSKEDLARDAQANLNFKARTLKKLRDVPIIKFESLQNKKSLATLRNIAVEINSNNKAEVLFTSLSSQLKSKDVAYAMASYMQSDDLKIALIDFTKNKQTPNVENNQKSYGLFTILHNEAKISVLLPSSSLSSIEFIGRRDFQSQLQSLQSNFDLIFLSADNDDAISLASALSNSPPTHITSAKVKRTKSEDLTKLQTLIPIQGLLYE